MLRVSVLVLALFVCDATIAVAKTPLGVPNTGNAPPTGSPIQIEDCVAGNDGNGLLAKSDGRFKIVFTNESRVPADLVRFRVDYGDESFAIRDCPTFNARLQSVATAAKSQSVGCAIIRSNSCRSECDLDCDRRAPRSLVPSACRCPGYRRRDPPRR